MQAIFYTCHAQFVCLMWMHIFLCAHLLHNILGLIFDGGLYHNMLRRLRAIAAHHQLWYDTLYIRVAKCCNSACAYGSRHVWARVSILQTTFIYTRLMISAVHGFGFEVVRLMQEIFGIMWPSCCWNYAVVHWLLRRRIRLPAHVAADVRNPVISRISNYRD